MFFNLNSQRDEKFELFSQGTYDFKNLRNETLFITDYETVKNPHLTGWLQNCGSEKAPVCGMFALLNE